MTEPLNKKGTMSGSKSTLPTITPSFLNFPTPSSTSSSPAVAVSPPGPASIEAAISYYFGPLLPFDAQKLSSSNYLIVFSGDEASKEVIETLNNVQVLLASHEQPQYSIRLNSSHRLQKSILRRSGIPEPLVFLSNGVLLGGYNELKKLAQENKLRDFAKTQATEGYQLSRLTVEVKDPPKPEKRINYPTLPSSPSQSQDLSALDRAVETTIWGIKGLIRGTFSSSTSSANTTNQTSSSTTSTSSATSEKKDDEMEVTAVRKGWLSNESVIIRMSVSDDSFSIVDPYFMDIKRICQFSQITNVVLAGGDWIIILFQDNASEYFKMKQEKFFIDLLLYKSKGAVPLFLEWFRPYQSIVSDKQIFGITLNDVLEKTPSRTIPSFFTDALAFVDSKSDTEGIFRLSGDRLIINNAVAVLNKGEPYDIRANMDVHTAASLIKKFLADLPTPIFPPFLYNSLIAARKDPDQLKAVLSKLPISHEVFLLPLFKLLSNIISKSGKNKMTSSNIATIFIPCLFPNEDPLVTLRDSPMLSEILIKVLENWKFYFGHLDEGNDQSL